MTTQQKIGATILIGVLVLGIIFKFYAPFHAFVWLLAVIGAVVIELRDNKPTKSLTTEQIVAKYSAKRQAKINRDANRDQRFKEEVRQRRAENAANQRYQPPQTDTLKREISVDKFAKLRKMVNGQDAVARRLIEGNLKLFPDKSPDWACDKAIADLERDRR